MFVRHILPVSNKCIKEIGSVYFVVDGKIVSTFIFPAVAKISIYLLKIDLEAILPALKNSHEYPHKWIALYPAK